MRIFYSSKSKKKMLWKMGKQKSKEGKEINNEKIQLDKYGFIKFDDEGICYLDKEKTLFYTKKCVNRITKMAVETLQLQQKYSQLPQIMVNFFENPNQLTEQENKLLNSAYKIAPLRDKMKKIYAQKVLFSNKDYPGEFMENIIEKWVSEHIKIQEYEKGTKNMKIDMGTSEEGEQIHKYAIKKLLNTGEVTIIEKRYYDEDKQENEKTVGIDPEGKTIKLDVNTKNEGELIDVHEIRSFQDGKLIQRVEKREISKDGEPEKIIWIDEEYNTVKVDLETEKEGELVDIHEEKKFLDGNVFQKIEKRILNQRPEYESGKISHYQKAEKVVWIDQNMNTVLLDPNSEDEGELVEIYGLATLANGISIQKVKKRLKNRKKSQEQKIYVNKDKQTIKIDAGTDNESDLVGLITFKKLLNGETVQIIKKRDKNNEESQVWINTRNNTIFYTDEKGKKRDTLLGSDVFPDTNLNKPLYFGGIRGDGVIMLTNNKPSR